MEKVVLWAGEGAYSKGPYFTGPGIISKGLSVRSRFTDFTVWQKSQVIPSWTRGSWRSVAWVNRVAGAWQARQSFRESCPCVSSLSFTAAWKAGSVTARAWADSLQAL